MRETGDEFTSTGERQFRLPGLCVNKITHSSTEVRTAETAGKCQLDRNVVIADILQLLSIVEYFKNVK